VLKKLLVLSLLICGAAIFAAEIEGVFFPDTLDIGEKKLVLNGTGLRLKKILLVSVKVYAAGLYLEQKETDPRKIMNEDKTKEAFLEGFENNGGAEAPKLKTQTDKFIAFWPDMEKNAEAKLIYIPGTGTKVMIKEKEAGTIEGAQFGKLLFSVWLGPEPPNEELKTGLLGNK